MCKIEIIYNIVLHIFAKQTMFYCVHSNNIDLYWIKKYIQMCVFHVVPSIIESRYEAIFQKPLNQVIATNLEIVRM